MLRRFLGLQNGNASVEAVVVIPFLIWGCMSVFTLTDAFIKKFKVTQSTFAIADAISRELESVGSAYIDGLNTLHTQVTEALSPTSTRVTLFHFDADLGRIEMDWSYATVGAVAHSEATLLDLQAEFPALANGESLVFVETWRGYSAVFGDLIGDVTLKETAFARLRYAPTIAWVDA